MQSKNDISELSSGTIIQEQQRQVILEAINNYLKWRNNKSASDGRDYPINLFTWLRHYTAFGENCSNQSFRKNSASHTIPIWKKNRSFIANGKTTLRIF